MPLPMSHLSRPAFERGLDALSGLLRKAETHAIESGNDGAALLQARLAPDMHPLVKQVQIATDTAKGAIARLSGTANPSFPDTETSFSEIHERIARALAFVRSVPPEALDGSEARPIELKTPTRTLRFVGQDYLLGFALPNFYFHLAITHGILRHKGVPVGKTDYLGLA